MADNAGLHALGPREGVPSADLETSWRTTCLGALLVCREVIPIMRAQGGGPIINGGSVAGLVGLPFQGSYCGSKSALEAPTEGPRAELRPFGIRVSIIVPGDIRHQDCHAGTSVSPDCTRALSRVRPGRTRKKAIAPSSWSYSP